MAGSRTTEACEPRQVRKEAAAAMSTMCCGKPGHQYTHPPALANFVGIVVGFLNVYYDTPAEPPPCPTEAGQFN